jgi:lactoylglutathione lyase
MKKLLLFLVSAMLLIATADSIMAQQKKPVLNHIALYVKDLKTSTAFYMDVVGLDTIPEPFHDGKHTWFTISDNSHLHLIMGAATITNHDKNSHLCFSVPYVEEVVAQLDKKGIGYEDWTGGKQKIQVRVDGIKQIYFKDPDGYWIEINNDYPKQLK